MILFQAMLLLLAVLLLFSTSNGFDSYVLSEKEMIYNYEANLSVRTNHHQPHSNTFALKSKLRLQIHQTNSIKVQFFDVNYVLNTKPSSGEEAYQKLPEEFIDLEEFFTILYDSKRSGMVYGIETFVSEKENVRNIKKAIASILQLSNELTYVDTNRVFTTKEQSLYGDQLVSYNVVLGNNQLQVTKSNQESPTSDRLYRYFESNFEALAGCDVPTEHPIVDKVERKYVIAARNNEKVVESILSEATIFDNQFEGKSDSKIVEVKQTFDLVEIKDLQPVYGRKIEDRRTTDIFYELFDENVEVEALPDITFGRTIIDFDQLFTRANKILGNIAKHFDRDIQSIEAPDVLDVNQIRGVLKYFDVANLEKFRQSLLKTPNFLEIFYEVLPMVGSRASVLMIKRLIVAKVVPEEVAVSLLQQFPEGIIMPSRSLVGELEELPRLNFTYNWRIRNVAILSFGAVVHRSYDYEEKKARIALMRRGLSEGQFQSKTPLPPVPDYESYVAEYVDQIRTAKELEVRLAFIDGLYNMKMESSVKLLKPGIDGQWWNCHHSRHHAIWSVLSALALKGPQAVYNFYWPILTNRQEHIEFRLESYYFIMESKPNLQMLDNIAQFMMNETDDELYKFHYMYVKSFKDSTDVCRRKFTTGLQHVFKYMKEPTRGLSTVHVTDYVDSQYGFGGGTSVLAPNTNDSYYFMFTQRNQLGFTPIKTDIFIKLYGVKEANDASDYPSIPKFLLQHGRKGMHLEALLLKHNRFVNSYYFNENNIDWQTILDTISGKKVFTFKKQWLNIDPFRYDRALIPTDLGMPAVWEYSLPVITKQDLDVNLDNSDKVWSRLNFHYHSSAWMSNRNGLAVYNPVVDLWQGVHRYNTLVMVYPIRFDINYDSRDGSAKITWKKKEDQNDFGLVTRTASRVFLQNDLGKTTFLESCPSCKQSQFVMKDAKQIQSFMRRGQNLDIGHQWLVTAYDDDDRITDGSFRNLLKHMQKSSNNNFETYMDHYSLSLSHLSHYLAFAPLPGSYGLSIRVQPMKDVDNIELIIRISGSDFKASRSPNLNFNYIYNVNGVNKTLRTWNAITEASLEYNTESYKIDVTRAGEPLYKFSIDGKHKWTRNGFDGHITAAFGQCKSTECNEDLTTLQIEMIGERLSDQIASFEKCPSSTPIINCLAVYNSVQNFSYDIKYDNISKKVQDFFETFASHFRDDSWHYYHEYLAENDVGENTIKVNMVFRPDGKKQDVFMFTPQRRYEILEVPIRVNWEVIPEGELIMPHVRNVFLLHYKNQLDYCHVHSKDLSSNWTVYFADSPQQPEHVMYLKKADSSKPPKIELKVVYGSEEFLNVPSSDNKGNEISEKDWMYREVALESPERTFLIFPHWGVYLNLNGDDLTLAVSKGIQPRYGHCFVDN